MFDFTSFEEILIKSGIHQKRQDLTKIYAHFDTGKNELISAAAFLAALEGEMNARRAAMVKRVFDATGGDWNKYNAAAHPEVSTGAKSPEQVDSENQKCIALMAAGPTMTWEQFSEFYSTKSATDPYDDNRFIASLSGPWGVTEDGAGNAVTPQFLRQVQCVLWEKVRQKTECGKQASETLRLRFKKLDLEDTGFVTYDKFIFGLEQFGVNVDATISTALFNFYAENGRLDVAHFAKSVCKEAE